MFNCAVGREEHCKQISLACVGSAHSVWATLSLPQFKVECTSQVHTAQAPGCSAWVVSQVRPAFHALSRSKLLRFRFLGTPQRCRLHWACVLCSSQDRAAQATRCSKSAVSSGRGSVLSPPPSQPLSFPGAQWARLPRCPVCLFWGADLWL